MSKRIVIIVSGGVADYCADDGVQVLLIDTDNLDTGYDEEFPNLISSEEIKGFEHLVPQWIKDDYVDSGNI
jgi:hypothetical protein